MTINITYFVHGTTTDNEQHVSSGWKDVDLSELGIQQSSLVSKDLEGSALGLTQQLS